MRLRWSICWARLDPTEGHEQAGRRPVLILSGEPFNRSSGLVTAVPLTTARRPPRSWEVLLPAGTANLSADSIVLGAHMRTLSRARLVLPPLGRIVETSQRLEIAQALLNHLGFADLDRLEFEE